MIIEIIGLPGSGKTTLMKKLKDDFPDSFLSFDDAYNDYFSNLFLIKLMKKISKKNTLILRFFSLHFLINVIISYFKMWHNISLVKKIINKKIMNFKIRKKFLKFMINRTILQDLFNRYFSKKILIFEEGVLQIFLTYMKDGSFLSKLQHLKSKVIIIKADPKKCYDRMLLRKEGFPWSEGLYDKNRQEELEQRYSNLFLIEEWLQISNIPILSLEFVFEDYDRETFFNFIQNKST